jgi:hypothetical protein
VNILATSGSKEFRACPAFRANAPGHAFPEAEETLAYARECADKYRTGYVVWQFYGASWRIIARVSPGTGKGA